MSLIALREVKPRITSVGSAKDNSLVIDHTPAHLLELESKDGRTRIWSADLILTFDSKGVESMTEVPLSERADDALVSGTIRYG